MARLKSVKVLDEGGRISDEVDIRRPVAIEVQYLRLEGEPNVRASANLHFYNEDGVCLFITNAFNDREWWQRGPQPGLVRSTCRIPGNFLAEGQIFILAAVSSYNPTRIHASERDAVAFQVVDRSFGDGTRGEYVNEWPGVVRPMLEWSVETDAISG